MFSASERWNRIGSCCTIAICDARLADGSTLGDVVAVDQDTPTVHVMQPLDQLHERGLAGARQADQADLLARADGDVLRPSYSGW
jgi:hypothetical protein